jgi:hypothetical protein
MRTNRFFRAQVATYDAPLARPCPACPGRLMLPFDGDQGVSVILPETALLAAGDNMTVR